MHQIKASSFAWALNQNSLYINQNLKKQIDFLNKNEGQHALSYSSDHLPGTLLKI